MFGIEIKDLLLMAITGMFMGFGSALGNYLAQRSFIRQLEKINMPKINGNDKKPVK